MSFAFKYYRNSKIHYSSDSSESRGSSGEDNDSLVSSLDHRDREITQETVQAPSTAVTLDFQDMPPSRSTQGGSNAKGNVIQTVEVSSAILRHKSSISFQNFS
ncbi:uncharacterized protein LOC113684728 [Pocillopora damicornis]|uniref:uncharacterized protein LOC113684728 n=1 Tax=Pocillopora damicornis TaxID=46731 RepID=UPI000F552AC5|nr:uncharacterized protein LOC113684728 [Pocillopora damicornis]